MSWSGYRAGASTAAVYGPGAAAAEQRGRVLNVQKVSSTVPGALSESGAGALLRGRGAELPAGAVSELRSDGPSHGLCKAREITPGAFAEHGAGAALRLQGAGEHPAHEPSQWRHKAREQTPGAFAESGAGALIRMQGRDSPDRARQAYGAPGTVPHDELMPRAALLMRGGEGDRAGAPLRPSDKYRSLALPDAAQRPVASAGEYSVVHGEHSVRSPAAATRHGAFSSPHVRPDQRVHAEVLMQVAPRTGDAMGAREQLAERDREAGARAPAQMFGGQRPSESKMALLRESKPFDPLVENHRIYGSGKSINPARFARTSPFATSD